MRLEIICTLLLPLGDVACKRNKKGKVDTSSSDEGWSNDKHYWETSGSSDDNSGDTDVKDLSFSGKLRRQLAFSLFLQSPGENAICSPISALMPLGKLALGAEGTTLKELLAAIGVKKVSEVKQQFKKMIGEFRNTAGADISVCSGVYVNENIKLKSEFRNNVQSVFDTDVERVDFRNPKRAADKINAWVMKHTNNKIDHLLDATDISPSTSVILVNTVYFSAKWLYPFDNAKDRSFYGTNGEEDIPMMNCENNFKYYDSSSLNAEVVAIPYKGNSKLSFVIVLPKSKSSTSLTLLLKGLKTAPDLLKDAMKKMKSQSLVLSIPKFKIEKRFDLSVQYRNIGLNSMFHKGLTKIAEGQDLFVSRAIQSALINVHEFGTTAAAASVVMNFGASAPSKKKKVVADHPFLFTIVVKNQQLFTGIFTSSSTGSSPWGS
ncbi:antichymotrypsin-2-like isoform X2 [Hyposmocoma kahamanoa]|uniref:antichymotrypsin-2-like isoform X2 n=1 Tax=Hyposmocoma kahamanoa TaxID=1477025 RepID=UPI000E6D9DDD|nr:antichymotrypsin-2-like isoform X2 [Hyposmocoma kahamanoa]